MYKRILEYMINNLYAVLALLPVEPWLGRCQDLYVAMDAVEDCIHQTGQMLVVIHPLCLQVYGSGLQTRAFQYVR